MENTAESYAISIRDECETSDDTGLEITAITRLKHADLHEAAKRIGSQSALARHLGVSAQEIGMWVNLTRCPPTEPRERSRWTEEFLHTFEVKLLDLTGKTLDELFPAELRDNAAFLESPKKFEQRSKVKAQALLDYAEHTRERMETQANCLITEVVDNSERDASIEKVMRSLTYREREILKLRFGLGDGESHTLEETARIFKVTKERIRQIETRAIRKLQNNTRSDLIKAWGLPLREYEESLPATNHETRKP